MEAIQKAVPCVIQERKGHTEILAFVHPPPLQDKQIPKGTVDPKEDIEQAALRELYEESGLSDCSIDRNLGSYEVISEGELERQIWHVFILKSNSPLPDAWTHTVTGDGRDAGMKFRYFWHNLESDEEGFHPIFQKLLAFVRQHFREAI